MVRRIFSGLAALVLILISAVSLFATGQSEAPDVKSVKLTHWTFQEPDKRYFEQRAADFSVARPEVRLVVESTNFPFEEMHDKLMIALMSGVGAPDLADVEVAKMGLYMRGKDIPFYDLTDLINKPEYRGKFFEPKIKSFTYFGKVWGIPQDIDVGVVYYNTEVLGKAGVDVDSIKTWDDFINAGKKVTRDVDGDGAPDVWMTTVEVNDFHGTLGIAKQLGGGVYDSSGNLLLTSQANIDALQMLQDFIYTDKIATITPGGYTHDATFFAFANAGKVAAIMMPSWYLNRFTDSMPDLQGKIAVRSLPQAVPGGRRSYMSGGTATVITRQIKSDNLQVAKDFLEFSKMSYESNLKFWTEVGFDPWRVDIYSDPAAMKPLPAFNNEPVLKTIKGLVDNNQVPTDYTGPLYAEVLEQYRENIPFRVFKNREDPKTVLNDALKQVLARASE